MSDRPIATIENCRAAVISAVHQVSFDKLATRFSKSDTGGKDGKAWIPADIEPGPRKGERVKSVSFLVLDIEADAESVKDENGNLQKDQHGDVIKKVIGPEPPGVDEMLAELSLHGWRCILHTSYSHTAEHPRYRLTFDPSRPLLADELKPLGLHIVGLLGIADCTDTGCLDPARLFYLPRCPADRQSLFRHGKTEGDPLPVDDLLREARKIEAAQKSATAGRRTGQSGNVIQAFNDAHDVGMILEQHGYQQKGRKRWIWPGSTTGLPGVRMLPNSTPERVYSSHGGDPLNDGHAHDAFDCCRILEHGGDWMAAVREAARLLGMEGRGSDYSGAGRGEYQAEEGNAPAGEYARNVDLIRASDVTPEAIDWLWNGWLAAGKMHVFGGAPGTGKTTISMGLAATVTIGGRWPDGTRSVAGNVVIWSGEDDPADTLIPRLALSGADLSRVYFIAEIREGNERRSFDPARDMEPLRRKLAEIGGVKLLVVDPVVSAIAGDSHKNAEVRRGLQPLVDLAGTMRCALLGITHFSKGTGGRDPVERLTGSLAFGALARIVLVAAKHQEEGEDGRTVRLFCRAKSNIGPDDGGFEYDLHKAELKTHPGIFASSVLWGEAVEGAARELLATADATGDDEEGNTLADAKRFLSDLLASGPLRAGEVFKDADQAGYSKRSIQRAANAIKVERHKDGMRGGWSWRLPLKMPTAPEDAVDARLKSLAPLAPSTTSSIVEVEI